MGDGFYRDGLPVGLYTNKISLERECHVGDLKPLKNVPHCVNRTVWTKDFAHIWGSVGRKYLLFLSDAGTPLSVGRAHHSLLLGRVLAECKDG